MKPLAFVICAFGLNTVALAGLNSDSLTRALNSPKAKAALQHLEILSVQKLNDRKGRASFDFTIVVCGLRPLESGIEVVKTRIDGILSQLPESERGVVTQTFQQLDPSELKSQPNCDSI